MNIAIKLIGRLLFVNFMVGRRKCSTGECRRGKYILTTSKRKYSVTQATSTSSRTCLLPLRSYLLFGQKICRCIVTLGLSRNDDQPIPNTHAHCSKENVPSSNFEANKFEVIEKLEKEVSLLRHQLSTLETKVDDQFNALKIFILESFKKFMADSTVVLKDNPTTHTSGSKKCKQDDVHHQVEPSRANTGDQSVDDAMLTYAGEECGIHNTPTFDKFDLSDLRKSQLVAMENKIPYVPTVEEPRAKAPRKHARSLFTDFSETDDGSVQRPVTFKRKHPFDSYANFEVPAELVDSFQLWIKQKMSKKRGSDCGLYTCAFAEYHSQGQLDMPDYFIRPYLFRLRYGALFWKYRSQKIEEEAVGESEVMGKAVS